MIFRESIESQVKSVCTACRSITQFPDKNCQSITQSVNQTTKCDKRDAKQRAQNNSKGDFLSRWVFLSFPPNTKNHPHNSQSFLSLDFFDPLNSLFYWRVRTNPINLLILSVLFFKVASNLEIGRDRQRQQKKKSLQSRFTFFIFYF